MSPLTRCVRLATFCGYPDGERDDRIKEINLVTGKCNALMK